MSRQLCRDCKHYIEPTDYCEQNQFDFEERVMEDCIDTEPKEELIEWCRLYEWNGDQR